MTIRTPLVSALLLILLPLGAALAQSTAQINGTVRDETGAAIPGVEIKATNTGTGSVRTVTTEATGLVP
ncbi:MAG TPA: carboxypeptidase-like regulatory domain-containing protein [Bryobacteraceae bacterium]|nr:carboxypeptidase-like regulatory domain-containing protein [Bryobacteraceae bacterium]